MRGGSQVSPWLDRVPYVIRLNILARRSDIKMASCCCFLVFLLFLLESVIRHMGQIVPVSGVRLVYVYARLR